MNKPIFNHTNWIEILYTTLILVAIACIPTSCQTNIDMDKELSTPMLVVNSFISPDTTVSAHVSLSRFLLSDTVSYTQVNNADVSVFVNHQWVERMTLSYHGTYVGSYRPRPGDVIQITAKVPSMNEVSAETVIPQRPNVIHMDTTMTIERINYIIASNDTIAKEIFYRVKFYLTFKDEANETNYYRIIVHNKNYYFISAWNTLIESLNENYNFTYNDMLSGGNDNISTNLGNTGTKKNNRYAIFDDALINGREKTLTFYADYYIYKRTAKDNSHNQQTEKTDIEISLQNISKDYYLYLKSRNDFAESGNSLYAEPVQIKNNIKGGIGILGSYTSSSKKTLFIR